ncbi:unnamed protein product [Dovyalis caffra]|uniref:Helicase C-terminal domain-containing protein n=1 Tax=Dovyalis caffra TaxID=77055 RepID=A0AAV1RY10_9ROSI|nr:unnamed protein product [Dovyalis caffra]
MDPSLQISLTKGSKEVDILDFGIKASGKLQLLDEMLSSIKEKGLRVLILFQSIGGSGKDNIGDILDDFVRQRFGKGSYERVDGHVLRSRKQTALNNFNNHQEGTFVFLLETRACSPSIKLSSVDTVIIFASDWNPMTDIRNLQKITLHSQFDRINIFRLYSSCTVEEKVLIIAKQDKTLDSNLQSISRGASHMLLMWGASYLFDKLAEFHCGNNPTSSGNTLFEQSHLKDVIQEFLTIIIQKGKDNTPSNSIILKVKQNQGSYTTNFPLHGEQNIQLLDEELPHMFWKKLLEGKQPQWKYSSGSSQRNRKRVKYIDDIQKKSEVEGDDVVKKRNKVANNSADSPSLKAAPIGTSGAPVRNMSRFMPSSTGCLNTTDANHVSNITHLNSNLSEVLRANIVEYNERMNLHDSEKSLHLVLKPEIAKLCEILQLPHSDSDGLLSLPCLIKCPLRVLRGKSHGPQRTFNVAASPKAADFSNEDLSKNQSNGRSSLSTPSKTQKVRIEVENLRPSQEFSVDQVLSHLGLAQNDYSKSIKDIEKKCDKQRRKLLQRQHEEREEFEKKYEEEKAELELMHITEAAVIRLHSNISVRTDKLKILDSEYAKAFVELKRQMDIRLNNLLESQLATSNKLQERKAQWIEGVKSWAHAELIDKQPANEFGYNQENAVTLNSCSKEQIPERAQSMLDGDVPLEVRETVSSNEDVPLGVMVASEPMSDGATSSMLHRELPLEAPQTASGRHVSEDVLSVNSSPCEEQTSARSTSGMDVREVLLEVPETAPLEAEEDVNRIVEKDGVSGMVSDNAIEVDQRNGVVCIPNQESHYDDITAVNQENGEVLLGVAGNSGVYQQDEEDPSVVRETSCEVVGSGSTGRDNSGVRVPALHYDTGVNQQSGVLPSGGFETATGAELGAGHTRQEIDRTHTEASDNSQPTESSRLRDSIAQVCDNQIAFQQVDALATEPVVVGSDQSPSDAPVTEHTLQLLPSPNSSAGSHLTTSFAQDVLADLNFDESGTLVSNLRTAPVTSTNSNRLITAPAVHMPVSMSQDPLENELDRIRKETAQIIKIHEDTKLQLKSDCEKEIQEVVAQIRSKHDVKLKEIESEFLCKKKEMDDIKNKVLMNKILAEAFRAKCMDSKASSTPFRQQEMTSSIVQQLLQLSQPTAQRPIITDPYSTGLLSAGLQPTPTCTPPAPPRQVVHSSELFSGTPTRPPHISSTLTSTSPAPPRQVVHSSALFSGTPTRPPHISSISPTTSNLRVSSEIRAPAPHLQRFRPSLSISTTGLPSFPRGMQSQQVSTTSPTLSEIPSRAPATAHQSGPRTMTNGRESMGISPSRTSLQGLESLMNVDNQTNTNPPQAFSFPPLTDLSSNPNPLPQPELSLPTDPASEVVCLSDDE